MTHDPLIADSAARLFAHHVDKGCLERAEAGVLDAALWQRVEDAGFPLLMATEAAGGFGLDWQAAFAVLHGLGHWQVPLPLAETMLAALLATRAGLPLPAGPLTLIEQGQGNALVLAPEASGHGGLFTLSGSAHGVPWARHASAALVSLADGRVALLPLRGHPGVQVEVQVEVEVQPHTNLAGLPSDTLVLQGARLSALAPNPLPLAQPVWTLGALARSIMMVGALECTLAQAVRYAGERVQFGKPIGSQQALQQQLALMAGDVAAARMAALVAAADASGHGTGAAGEGGDGAVDPHAARFSIAVAKLRAGEAATRGNAIAHQVHGAIGFTHEHALHWATRRLWAWREEFGTESHWALELGRAAIAARASGFWPGLTRKHFS